MSRTDHNKPEVYSPESSIVAPFSSTLFEMLKDAKIDATVIQMDHCAMSFP
jgi:hypothetical protein